MAFQNTIVWTCLIVSTQARHDGDFFQKFNMHIDKYNPIILFKRDFLWHFSKTIVKTYFVILKIILNIDDDLILKIELTSFNVATMHAQNVAPKRPLYYRR